MSIRLLVAWDGRPANTIIPNLGASTEASLVLQGIASYDLTNGVAWEPNKPYLQSPDMGGAGTGLTPIAPGTLLANTTPGSAVPTPIPIDSLPLSTAAAAAIATRAQAPTYLGVEVANEAAMVALADATKLSWVWRLDTGTRWDFVGADPTDADDWRESSSPAGVPGDGTIGTVKLGGDITTPGKALLVAASAAAQRTAVGAAPLGPVGLYFRGSVSSVSDANPGSGYFRWNNATQASATKLYLSKTTGDGFDANGVLRLMGGGQILTIIQADDPSKWQRWLITGTVEASTYYKLSVIRVGGSASQIDGEGTRVQFMFEPAPVAYSGAITGDISAITFNADGSAATVTIAGLTWTLAYNSNGTINTETVTLSGAPNLVRTYTYNANGEFTGVTGNVERGGAITMTLAQAIALGTLGPSAAGCRIFVIDLNGGQEFCWNGTWWKAPGGSFTLAVSGAVDLPNTALTTEQTLWSVTLPGRFMGPTGAAEFIGRIANNNNANAKTHRLKFGGTTILTNAATTNINHTYRRTIENNGAANAQVFTASSTSTQPGSASGASATATVDTNQDVTLAVTGQNAVAGDTITMHSGRWVIHQGW